jgi:hypothetical protein
MTRIDCGIWYGFWRVGRSGGSGWTISLILCSSTREVMEIKGAVPRVHTNSWIFQRKIKTEGKQ